jgi:adenylosuccinate lyase
LKSDPEVTRLIPESEIVACFDLAHHLKQVDTIFARVFGGNP